MRRIHVDCFEEDTTKPAKHDECEPQSKRQIKRRVKSIQWSRDQIAAISLVEC